MKKVFRWVVLVSILYSIWANYSFYKDMRATYAFTLTLGWFLLYWRQDYITSRDDKEYAKIIKSSREIMIDQQDALEVLKDKLAEHENL